MNRIICDTNIWYQLNNGIISKPEKFEIFVTFLSIEEISLTYNLDQKTDYIRDVIRTAMKVSNGFFEMPPFHHIVVKENNSLTRNDFYPIIEGFLSFTELIANERITQENLKETLPYREKRKKLHAKVAQEINDLAAIAKQTNMGKMKYWKLDTVNDSREVVKRWIESSTGMTISESFKWKNIELFEKTMEYWFKELAIYTPLLVKTNDIVDVFNLLYVEPGDLYWCRDKPWNKRIQKAGMSKYLFEVM